MSICFIFIQSLQQNDFFSLRLGGHGEIDQPLQKRSPEEIKCIQGELTRTVIVLPTEWCGLYDVELPPLAESKAREAIPFALEEQLAQPLHELHFCFDKAFYHDNRYLVIVLSKQIMHDWMNKLRQLNIGYDAITLAWFALDSNEGCVLEQTLMVNAPQFQGVLSEDIWTQCAQEYQPLLQWHIFAEGTTLKNIPESISHRDSYYIWFAKRLLKTKFINLCQAEFQHKTSQAQVKYWYQLAGILASVGLLAFVAMHWGAHRLISQRIKVIDQQIMQSYKVFFPQAQQVISPRIRIEQLLKKNRSGHHAELWSLMESLSIVLIQEKSQPLANEPILQSIQYQNQIMTLTLWCHDFSSLEKIEAALKNRGVMVHQLSAATEKDKVVAKLELSL